jgi:hypothetical protein
MIRGIRSLFHYFPKRVKENRFRVDHIYMGGGKGASL